MTCGVVFCPCQVAALEEFNQQFSSLYIIFMQQLQTVVPPGTDVPSAYDQGSDEDQAFVQNLGLFFTTFLKVGPLAHPCHMPSSTQQPLCQFIYGASMSCCAEREHGMLFAVTIPPSITPT